MSTYTELKKLAIEAALVSTSGAALGWDQETYLPPEGNDWRSRQLAWLAGREHELRTSEIWRRTLEECSADNDRDAASLAEMRRDFQRANRLSTSFVERETALTSRAKSAWADARKRDDFSSFAPFLGQLVELAREKAELLGYSGEPYDALIEPYERGMSAVAVATLFEELAPSLREIAAAAVERSSLQPASLPPGPYPIASQMAFNREIAEAIGFDFGRGRIDTTAHPFCTTLGPADVRLTTRYDEADFTSSLFGVMHEAGHGLYEQGLRAEDFGTPAGNACSLGIHESQSRLWENHVGRSRPFWEKWFPVAVGHFPQLARLSLEAFLGYVHRSTFSPIRVEADEATYDLHILLRFDIERRLIQGELEVKDVPTAWNEAFRSSFGLLPASDREGCLQDIHWSMGGIGYFPTYTLGNLAAAQLFKSAGNDPVIAAANQSADYGPLLAWLRTHIHDFGATLAPADLLHQATGDAPSSHAHLDHLRARYLG